jgi:hypothetical protein
MVHRREARLFLEDNVELFAEFLFERCVGILFVESLRIN